MDNKYLIICNNNKDYMSVGIGMCIFSQMYLIVFLNMFIVIFYLRNNQANYGNSWYAPLSVNLLISLFGM